MTRKITFPQLAASLSEATASNHETASAFLKAVFETISSALANGETVTVKGLGSFMVNEGNNVVWIPDEQLASAVNEPFAFFEAVELGEGVTEETFTEIPSIPNNAESDNNGEENTTEENVEIPELPADMPPIPPIAVSEEIDTTHSTSEVESIQKETDETPMTNENLNSEPEIEQTENQEEPQYTENKEEYTPENHCRRFRIHPCASFVVGLIAGLAIGYFGAIYAFDNGSKTAETETTGNEIVDKITDDEIIRPISPDSLISSTTDSTEITEKPDYNEEKSPYLAIDTITPNRYLTTMSRQYYGDYRFWVYIYEENKDKISNPDRINPGITVIIPHPEKYGIDSSDKESLAKAERKSIEIQSRKRK